MIWILDRNDTLQCILWNSKSVGNQKEKCPFFTGEVVESLAGTESLVFTMPADHENAKYVVVGAQAMVRGLDGEFCLYTIQRITDVHDSDNNLIKEVYAEPAYLELLDDMLEDVRPYNVTEEVALTRALSKSRWEVGIVESNTIASTNFYYINALAAIRKITETWKVEARFRVTFSGNKITHRYVDLLTRRGSFTGSRFEYGSGIKEIKRTVSMQNVATAMYGRGKGVEVGETEAGDPTYGRRLTFEDVEWSVAKGDPVDKPIGQKWVGNPVALRKWGRENGTRHIFSVFEDSEETDPEVLLEKTWEALLKAAEPEITYEMTLLYLENLSGYEHKRVRLGDTIIVKDKAFSPPISVSTRVIEMVRNLVDETDIKVVLGNYIPTMSANQKQQLEVMKAVSDRKGVWDRATIIGDDMKIPAQFLKDVVEELNANINASGGYVYISEDGEGLITYDKPRDQNPTKAIQLKGGSFRIANSKLPSGEWDWKTFGTGDGFVANMIIAGILRGERLKMDLNEGVFLLGNSPEDYSLYFDGYSLKIRLGGRSLDDRLDEIENEIENIELTPGPPGADGRGIVSTVVEYQVGTSGTTVPTGSWSRTIPSVDEGKYLWTRTTIKYTSGDDTVAYSVAKHGPKGADGQSQYVHIRYSANADGSGMTTNPTSTTKYVGIAVTNSPTAPPYTGFTWSKYVGEDGPQGPQGIPGPKGEDGKTTYTWVKYADTPTSGMSDYPDGKKYIGLAFNKTTEIESNDYSDYQWSLMPQNIDVGGRNLLRNSNFSDGLKYWDRYSSGTITTEVIEDDFFGKVIEINKDNVAGWISNSSIQNTAKLSVGDKVTISFWLNTDVSGNVSATIRTTGVATHVTNSESVPLKNGWNKYTFTLNTIRDSDTVSGWRLVITFSTSTNARILGANFKAEYGDIATDWTPAPEDVDQNISDSQEYLRGEIDEVNEKVDNVIGLVGEEPVVNIKQQLQDAFERELEAINKALYGDEGEEGILERLAALSGDTAGLYIDLADQAALIESLTGKISIEGDTILIGDVKASKGIRIKPDEIAFLEGESKVAWITGGLLYIDAGVFLTRLKIGNHVFQSVDGNPDITIVGYEP